MRRGKYLKNNVLPLVKPVLRCKARLGVKQALPVIKQVLRRKTKIYTVKQVLPVVKQVLPVVKQVLRHKTGFMAKTGFTSGKTGCML